MSGKKSAGALWAMLALLVAGVSGFWFLRDKGGAPPVQSGHESVASALGVPRSAGDPITETPVTGTLRYPAYDPAMRQARGPKAYSILRTGPWRGPGEARDQVLALKPRSDAGDGVASYEIELVVRACRQLIDGDAEKAWLAMREARMNPDPHYFERLEIQLEECAALSADAGLYEAAWLERAAEQGSVEAQLLYAIDADTVLGPAASSAERAGELQAWRDRSIHYLHALAEGGNVEALSQLAHVYNMGLQAAHDPVAAYAYLKVVSRLRPNAVYGDMLEQQRRRLNPGQQQDAAAQAEAIERRCCR